MTRLDDNVLMTMILDDSDDDPTSMLRSRLIVGDNGNDSMTMIIAMTMQMTQ